VTDGANAEGALLAGRYRLGMQIGAGGMGSVHKGVDERLRREVAIKLLPAKALGDAEAKERLRREAMSGAALRHPGIAHVYDVGDTDDGGAFLVMELVEGQSLRTLIDSASWDDRSRIAAIMETARALGAAHRTGLVHRDVKPDNIMLRSDGRIVLLDFGIAKPGGEGTGIATLTAAGAVVGTPAYFAPEQALGELIDPRTDQFALGVTAYELLARTIPWPASTGPKLMAAILRDPPLPLALPDTALATAVRPVLERALAKSREDRFVDVDAFADALGVAAGVTVSLRALPQITPSSPRGPTVLTPAELAPTQMQAGTLPSSTPKGDAPGVPATSAATWRRTPWIAITSLLLVLAGAGGLLARGELRRSAPPVASTAGTTPAVPWWEERPVTSSPEALKAYLDGVKSLREQTSRLRVNLERAIALDPDFAAAHLMRVLNFGCDGDVRDSYQKALSGRDRLSERERALIEAYEPVCQHDPPDEPETSRRLRALTERFPDHPMIWELASSDVTGGTQERLAALDRAIAIDPGFALAFNNRAGILLEIGDQGGALASIQSCLAVSPGAATCQGTVVDIAGSSGDCPRLEREAHRYILMGGAYGDIWVKLADSIVAQGEPLEGAREALRQAEGKSRNASFLPLEQAHADVVEGDFDAARRAAEAMDVAAGRSPLELDHELAAVAIVQIAEEVGDAAGARLAAERFLSRRAAWQPTFRRDDTALMLAALQQVGAITASDATRQREERIVRRQSAAAAEGARNGPFELWELFWARGAMTPADAREALDAMPEVPVSKASQFDADDESVGRTLLLAGRVDDAIPWLERASRACNALTAPFESTHAHWRLGQAREQKGDTAGACTEYQRVLDRWGHAKPRSVTADAVRERSKALGCRVSP
jgi:eukaryotic-like serine/threonine-protein kinase